MTSLIVFALGFMAGISLCWALRPRDSKPHEAASHSVVEKSLFNVANGRLCATDGYGYQMALTQIRGPK